MYQNQRKIFCFFLRGLRSEQGVDVFPCRRLWRHTDGQTAQNQHFLFSQEGGAKMAVFRIEKTRDYTVMSNHHLKDRTLTLKSKGLLSMMLSLPDEWNYTTRGLAAICREGVDSIGAALKKLEAHGYIRRTQLRDEKGKITDTEYVIYEMPQCEPLSSPGTPSPSTAKPYTETPAGARMG